MASSSQIQDVVEEIEVRRVALLSSQPSRWPVWAKEVWSLMETGRAPTANDAELVVLVAHQLLMLESEAALQDATIDAERLAKRGTKVRPSTLQRRAQKAVVLGARECARRGVRTAFDRELVLKAVARVATKKSQGKTLVEQAAMVVRSSDSYKGHAFELMDARAFNALKGSKGKVLELCPEHNRKAIDGVYKVGGKIVGEAQHKASTNASYITKAAKGRVPKSRELVVPRGAGRQAEMAVRGKMPVRRSAVSDAEVQRALSKAKKTKTAAQVGKTGAIRATARASVIGGMAAGAISLAGDARKVKDGEMSKGRAGKRAGLAAAEGATSTALAAGASIAAAPAMAAGTTALAGSAVAGTTAAATGLAVLGPVGVTIGAGLVVCWGFKKVRRAVGED